MGDAYRRPRERERDSKDDNVEYFGAGESYRPGGHSGQGPYRPPHMSRDTWNSERREPREPREFRDSREPRRDVRREEIDSYIPPTSARARRDSRSPPPATTLRGRSRSPPPRERDRDLFDQGRSPRRYSPRRDDRARSPPRRRSRSPITRPRSPDRRHDSPPRYDRARSPPRRQYSPPRDRRYRSRSRSPRKPYGNDSWRRRSPSPRAESSGPSRRSSPHVRPDRTSVAGSAPRSPTYRQTPPRDSRSNGDFQPPSGPGASRNGYTRPPPSGPSRSFSSTDTPPSGPARTPGSIPSGPRSGSGYYDSPRQDYNASLRGRTSLTYRAPTAPRAATYGEAPTGPSAAPPSGPRASSYSTRGDFSSSSASRGDYRSTSYNNPRPADSSSSSYPAPPPFRPSNNSTSLTYPRTQRFNTVQRELANTEKIIPGGKLLPSGLSAESERKMRQLEEEAERLRQDIAAKQAAKREAVNEWEVRERESARDAFRSELADESLRGLQEGEEMAAF